MFYLKGQPFRAKRQNWLLTLGALNVLIGSNGVGRSNFISFFELTKSILQQRFGAYTMDHGGMDNLLHKGRKVSEQIAGLLDFDNRNAFEFVLRPKPSGVGYVAQTADYFNNQGETAKNYLTKARGKEEGRKKHGRSKREVSTLQTHLRSQSAW